MIQWPKHFISAKQFQKGQIRLIWPFKMSIGNFGVNGKWQLGYFTFSTIWTLKFNGYTWNQCSCRTFALTNTTFLEAIYKMTFFSFSFLQNDYMCHLTATKKEEKNKTLFFSLQRSKIILPIHCAVIALSTTKQQQQQFNIDDRWLESTTLKY